MLDDEKTTTFSKVVRKRKVGYLISNLADIETDGLSTLQSTEQSEKFDTFRNETPYPSGRDYFGPHPNSIYNIC